MSNREQIEKVMPTMLRHEGIWHGTYRVIDLNGRVIDEHISRVECEFPSEGEYHYVQRNSFDWSDGRTYHTEFGGILRDDRLYWDTDTFTGYGWVTIDEVVMLTLQRKDVANASFTEIIVLGADPNNRARTWHWFKDGKLYQRTLCDEQRVGSN